MSRRIAFAGSLIIALAASVLALYSTFWQDDFTITTRSPSGTYTLVFEGKTTPNDTLAGSSEMVKLTVRKGETVYFVKDPFFGEKGLDPHFRGAYSNIEWFGDSILRLGRGGLSSQPFRDQITIFNATREKLPVVEVFYGRYQRFLIFDLESRGKLLLPASPEFGLIEASPSTVIYTAVNPTSNRHVQGRVEAPKRQNPSEGLDIIVTIRDD